MTFLKTIVTVILAGILTDNYVLSKFLGICPFLGVSKKLNTAMGMSAAVISSSITMSFSIFFIGTSIE